MDNIKNKDFHVSSWNENRVLRVNSDMIDEYMQYYIDNNLDGVSIAPHYGFRTNSIDFLEKYPFVKCVSVSCNDRKIDISVLSKLSNLKMLAISDFNQPLDLSNNSGLEEISIDWHNKVRLPIKSNTLKILRIWGFKPMNKNLLELGNWPTLEELSLIQGNIASLEGVEKYPLLNKMVLAYLRNLTSVKELQTSNLQNLELDTCKKIADIETLSEIKTLEKIIMGNCGKIPSLQFINKFANLNFFSFVNTEIEDGDLTPCLNLDYAGFDNKRHYSHTFEEIKQLIAARKN